MLYCCLESGDTTVRLLDVNVKFQVEPQGLLRHVRQRDLLTKF